MTFTLTRAARLRLVAAVTTLLVVIGAGSATAYWTASAQLDGTASAATVGITQTRPAALQNTYTSGKLSFADTVTIENQSSRDAELTLTVDAAENSGLPGSILIAVFAVTADGQCSPEARSDAAVSGGLGLTFSTELSGSSSVTLCVQTSLPARGAFLFPGAQTQIIVTSSLAYADGTGWRVDADGEGTAPLTQKVSPDPSQGARKLTCSHGWTAWDPLNVYPVDLSFTRPTGSEAMDYRVHLSRNGAIAQVDPRAVGIVEGRNGTTTVEISKRVLADAGWKAMSGAGGKAWVFIEYKPRSAGDGEWRSGGVGSLVLANYIANPSGVSCA